MALALPTPIGSSLSSHLNSRSIFSIQPSTRQQLIKSKMSAPRNYNFGESSDEEIPVPTFKCSALTNAILNDAAATKDAPPSKPKKITIEPEPKVFKTMGESVDFRNERQRVSPTISNEQKSYPRRKIRLSRAPESSAFRRSKSVSQVNSSAQNEISIDRNDNPLSLSTPAPIPKRVVRLPASTGSYLKLVGSSNLSSKRSDSASPGEEKVSIPMENPETGSRSINPVNQGSVSKYGQSTIGRLRHGEDTGVKKIAGAFMSVRPRRGRRRTSFEEQNPAEENFVQSSHETEDRDSNQPLSQGQSSASSRERQPNYGSFYQSSQYSSGSPIGSNIIPVSVLRTKSSVLSNSRPGSSQSRESNPHIQSLQPPQASRPKLPSTHDQENELRVSPKRNKQASPVYLEKNEKAMIRQYDLEIPAFRGENSSERPPLVSKSQNTPLRHAPPPPKMSILDAATSSAGATAASNFIGKRSRMKINGKIFARLDCIGRGGSSRVYRVMAENMKFFALKKVSLEDADENALRGFKGEIDLLKKLEGVERVIRLYDYELNENKGTLSVLMELGELDMNKILEVKLKSESSKFDPSFVRYYWKEMLECLQAIHEYDIVHSDLKPHNFVLVQGQLKLIDFGIANAIQTDQTVNVHRETQIGTPNYMSPESLMDFNSKPDARGRIPNAPKLMKLGKPSDIWSLGCILYQMTYGRAPFAHIQNQMQRCQAIINFNYPIEYPNVGVGDIPLPTPLIHTIKKCLNRNQHCRPSASELLNDKDPFLNPKELDEAAIPMTEELLGRILLNAASKFKDKTPTDAELLKLWPQGYFERIRKNKADARGKDG